MRTEYPLGGWFEEKSHWLRSSPWARPKNEDHDHQGLFAFSSIILVQSTCGLLLGDNDFPLAEYRFGEKGSRKINRSKIYNQWWQGCDAFEHNETRECVPAILLLQWQTVNVDMRPTKSRFGFGESLPTTTMYAREQAFEVGFLFLVPLRSGI